MVSEWRFKPNSSEHKAKMLTIQLPQSIPEDSNSFTFQLPTTPKTNTGPNISLGNTYQVITLYDLTALPRNGLQTQ
jgi:hypothetical protein